MPTKDLTGKKFGRLTVLHRDADNISKSGYKTVMWKCKCDCGNIITVRGKCLNEGVTRSCGCLQKELLSNRASVHKGFGTRLYAVWDSMRQRCNNPKNHAYSNYGGRGISICEDWNQFSAFRSWALLNGYDENAKRGKCTLDRIDVNGNYTPENCRWVDMRNQANNRRETILLTYEGITHTLPEWSNITGIKYCTIWKRYSNGLSAEEILKI